MLIHRSSVHFGFADVRLPEMAGFSEQTVERTQVPAKSHFR